MQVLWKIRWQWSFVRLRLPVRPETPRGPSQNPNGSGGEPAHMSPSPKIESTGNKTPLFPTHAARVNDLISPRLAAGSAAVVLTARDGVIALVAWSLIVICSVSVVVLYVQVSKLFSASWSFRFCCNMLVFEQVGDKVFVNTASIFL